MTKTIPLNNILPFGLILEEIKQENTELKEENTKLKEQLAHVTRTQAKQFRDNQKLQVKAERAKDVVNIDTARQIKQLKELLKESNNWLKAFYAYEQSDFVREQVKQCLTKTSQVLGE